jgi:hypothetical protein
MTRRANFWFIDGQALQYSHSATRNARGGLVLRSPGTSLPTTFALIKVEFTLKQIMNCKGD